MKDRYFLHPIFLFILFGISQPACQNSQEEVWETPSVAIEDLVFGNMLTINHVNSTAPEKSVLFKASFNDSQFGYLQYASRAIDSRRFQPYKLPFEWASLVIDKEYGIRIQTSLGEFTLMFVGQQNDQIKLKTNIDFLPETVIGQLHSLTVNSEFHQIAIEELIGSWNCDINNDRDVDLHIKKESLSLVSSDLTVENTPWRLSQDNLFLVLPTERIIIGLYKDKIAVPIDQVSNVMYLGIMPLDDPYYLEGKMEKKE